MTSTSGRPTGTISFSRRASSYAFGTASLIASSRTAPRPKRCSITRAGTLPLRNPGTDTCLAMDAYALSKLGCNSSKGSSTVSLTRVGLNDSRSVFTYISSVGDHGAGRHSWSGRGDSNSRSPAPKAGALATTLRPALAGTSYGRASFLECPVYSHKSGSFPPIEPIPLP